MSNSKSTKKVLASALKELMNEKSFNKISITDITDRCDMNRKSFYYHFKDKYELMGWIFENEFFEKLSIDSHENPKNTFSELADYFYENRDYYSKAFMVEGQNSFTDYFRNLIEPYAATQIKDMLPEYESDFLITFITDAIVGSFMRWITSKNCIEPEQFVNILRDFTQRFAIKALNN